MQYWKTTIWALLSSFFAIEIQAQNDTWIAVMSASEVAQTYSQESTTFPNKYIDAEWKKGNYITDITYNPNGWRVVMSGAKYTFQRWKKSKDFPSDFIETGWKEGLDVTKIAFGGDEWVVVMSKGAGFTNEVWGKRESYDEILTYIKGYWQTKDVISIAYGDGAWVVIMANGVEYSNQLIQTGVDFPSAWVQGQYKKGYNITSITYGEGKWLVVMSQLPKQRAESYEFTAEFPKDYIGREWNNKKRILFLHYNYNKDNSEYYEDYNQAGIEALNSKDYDGAIEYFTEALRIDNSNADTYNNLAWSKYLAGQCQGGLGDINKGLAIKKDPYAYHTRGAIELCLGRCREALNDFESAFNMSTTKDAYLYGDRGKAKACLGNYTDAIVDFNAALKIEPNNADYKKAKAEAEANLRKNVEPTVTWDYPYNAFSASAKSNIEVKACIHAEGAKINKVQLFLNGKDVSLSSRGFDVDEDCDATVSQNVNLQSGKNELEIVVTTDQKTTRSEKRTIEYKTTAGGDYHALLIGVSSYQDGSIKDLEKPAGDVKQLADVLSKQYTFNPSDVHVLANPTKEDILNKLIYLQERLGEKDNLMIFYAGHGIVKNEVGYWLPSDAKKDSRVSWLSNAELRDYVNSMKSKHVLIVADACFSGSIISGSYRDMTEFACAEMGKIPSRRAMTSGANTVVPDESVFFQYLLKKLQENTSSCFTAEDLYTKIKPAVINNSPNQQIPQFGVLPQAGDEGGNFIFKRR